MCALGLVDQKNHNCVTFYRNTSTIPERDYYFWNTVPCDSLLNFICQELPLDVGCRNKSGRDYSGQANTTETGEPCVSWNNPDALNHGEIFFGQKDWSHNFCRNPEGDKYPWCLIKDGTTSFCDIEPCENKTGPCLKYENKCGKFPA